MNTRTAIQPSRDPIVLGIGFSPSRNRFTASLSNGVRVFRADNCLTTCQPVIEKPTDVVSAIAICEVLDDRYIAYVPRSDSSTGTGHHVIFWDCILEKEICRYDLYEPVLGLRLSQRWMTVILQERTVVFAYHQLEQTASLPNDTASQDDPQELGDTILGPASVHALYPTSSNTFALASLRDNLLVLPAQSIGQVQVIPLPSGSKRVIRAHASTIRNLSLSPDEALVVTASEQGTLVRVWDTKTTDQVAEFRRGVEKAVIFSLAISSGNRWLASTSDKGTLHVYDLRPSPSSDRSASLNQDRQPAPRKAQNYAEHRLSAGSGEKESVAGFSSRSSPVSAISTVIPAGTIYQGSVQEYYGLRPPPPSASATGRETAVSAMSALRASPWAPKVLKDTRSIASAPFWIGDEGPHWQMGRSGGAGSRWTTTPAGTRKRVPLPVAPLPNDPLGRPPRGIVVFAPIDGNGVNEDNGAVLYVVGGGAEARWEAFDLVSSRPAQSGLEPGWALVKRGFRRYLSRQFVD